MCSHYLTQTYVVEQLFLLQLDIIILEESTAQVRSSLQVLHVEISIWKAMGTAL